MKAIIMKTIYRLIYKYRVWQCLKTGVTKRKVLQLVLFSYKYNIYAPFGLCYHLRDVQQDLNRSLDGRFLRFKDFNGFFEPEHEGCYWWPVYDRESRIKFLEDLISKQE